MKKRKKKLSELQKSVSKTLIFEGILIIVLIAFVGAKLFFHKVSYYSVESRTKNIEKTKAKDLDYYQTIGWLRVQGTNIDYPLILQQKAGFEYPVEMEEYVWSNNEDGKYHNKINISGHNIFNLSPHPQKSSSDFHRLEALMAFVYEDFAKKNEYIQLTLDGEDYLYKIYSAGFVYLNDMAILPKGDNTPEEMNDQIELFKSVSIYDYDIDVNNTDDMITIYTCTRFFGNKEKNFQITGRRVRDKEKVGRYEVKRNNNYNEIEEILMKGDDNNGENNEDSV